MSTAVIVRPREKSARASASKILFLEILPRVANRQHVDGFRLHAIDDSIALVDQLVDVWLVDPRNSAASLWEAHQLLDQGEYLLYQVRCGDRTVPGDPRDDLGNAIDSQGRPDDLHLRTRESTCCFADSCEMPSPLSS